MKRLVIVLAALGAVVTAQSGDPYYDLQSPAFQLVVKSSNTTLNDHLLGACHQGAAIEGLCLTSSTTNSPPTPYTTFHHNISSSASPNISASTPDTPGLLTYTLLAAGNLSVPSAMTFSTNPGSNLANPLFFPGWQNGQIVAFEPCGALYVSVYQDDTVSPPSVYSPPLKLQNWWMCLTRVGYLYEAVTWKMGVKGEPQNPSCQKVEIDRVWVPVTA